MSYDVLSQATEVYARADAKVFGDLTVAEFDAVHDAIDNVTEVGQNARKIEIDGERHDLDTVLGTVLAAMAERSEGQNADLRRRLMALGVGAVMPLSLAVAQRPVELWAQDMDGGEAGPCSRFIVEPVRQAFERYEQDRAAHLRALHAIIEPRRAELLGPAIGAPELGYTFENKGQLFHALLHTGNDSNRRKLLAGRGWQAGWERFLARMWREGILTKADYDAAQAIWDVMERLKRPGREAHRKICGFAFREVVPAAMKTPFGTYAGGFVPAVFEHRAGVGSGGRNAAEMFPTIAPAFTGQGKASDARSLELECSMLAAHMDQLLRFIHLEPVVQQIGRILNRPEILVALEEILPDMIDTVITPWLRMVRQPLAEGQPTTAEGRALSHGLRAIRRRAGVRSMMLDIVNATASVCSHSSTLADMSSRRLEAALLRFGRNGEGAAMRDEAATVSSVMQARMTRGSREMERRVHHAILKPGDRGLISEKAGIYGDILLQGTRSALELVLWHAAYDEAIGKGLGKAVATADSLVIQAMKSPFATETGTAFARLFTLFYSYFNGQAKILGGDLQPIMQSFGYMGAPRLFAIYLAGIALPAVLASVITEAGKGGLTRDGSAPGELAGFFLGDQAEGGAGMAPVADQAFDAFLKNWNDASRSNSSLKSVDAAEGDGLAALAMALGISRDRLVKAAGFGDTEDFDPILALDEVSPVSVGGAARSEPVQPQAPL
ncbi:hypothetical protein [Rhizobium rhizogenes]|uniref:Uncharacterized protein n=1 Tax=Rhizobium rhizogenes TaxID=359 RepID=A0AA92C7I4_RHIRH|nr:hypothetical protein [Rhizobium rhizogenes]PVE57160.1 hypothetical protein DC430_05395 [Rhizobium rhizogenes]PVE68325.1 hypothetical protein DC415_00820 [Agrobacterium tumefaciens]PVE78073.1 hypothetical protein DCP16_00820 [Sphingomonas sp. TPD3009]